MQHAFRVHLGKFESVRLRHAQTVPEHEKQKAPVAGGVPVALGRVYKFVNRATCGHLTSSLCLTGKDGLYIPHSRQDSDNVNTVFNRQVENQIIADRKTSQCGHKPISAYAHLWKLGNGLTSLLNFIEEPVRIIWTVLSYEPPNFFKIGFRLGAFENTRHQGVTPFAQRQGACGPEL